MNWTCKACGRTGEEQRWLYLPGTSELICAECYHWMIEAMDDRLNRMEMRVLAQSERRQQEIMGHLNMGAIRREVHQLLHSLWAVCDET